MFKNIRPVRNYFLLLMLLIVASSSLYAQSDEDPLPLNFPIPKAGNMLFYLQRDPTINTVVYTLNLDAKGNLNRSNPIHPYWIRYTENNLIKELNYIHRTFAYGVDTKEISKDKYEVRFVSYKKLVFLLQRSDKGYYVSVNVNNKTIKLSRIYVRIQGGSFWFPNVRYADLQGTDLATGKAVSERIYVK